MDCFIEAGYDRETIIILQDCRLFLQAVTLSDICTADGLCTSLQAWQGQHNESIYRPGWINTYNPRKKNGTRGEKCFVVCFSSPIPTLDHCFSPLVIGFPLLMMHGCGGSTLDPDHCLNDRMDDGSDGQEFNPIDGRTNTPHRQNGELKSSPQC